MTSFHRMHLGLAVAAAFAVGGAQAATYTYKGELTDGGRPANGKYDLRIRAYADAAGKQPIGGAFETYGVAVNAGRFSADLNLPDSASGTLWIDVALRPQKAGAGTDFIALGEREPVSITGGSCPGAWALDGNSGNPDGSFLGTTDQSDVTIKAWADVLQNTQMKMTTNGDIFLTTGPGNVGLVLGANGSASIKSTGDPSGASCDSGLYFARSGVAIFQTGGRTGAGNCNGVYLAAGGNSWNAPARRAGKANLAPADSSQVLDSLLKMPVSAWADQDSNVRHLGPMADDFHAAFGLNGDDDQGIASTDADGVALAAIQGLNAKLEAEVAELRQRLAALEAKVGR